MPRESNVWDDSGSHIVSGPGASDRPRGPEQYLEGGGINPEWASQNPDAAQAEISNQQWDDFVARYRPLEEQAIAQFLGSPEPAAKRAGLAAAAPMQHSTGMAQRELARRGANMTGAQRQAAQASQGLALARSQGNAENQTRRQVADSNLEGLGTMIGIGRGIMGGVNRDMGAAADMASQRQQANKNARANRNNQMLSSALSFAGMAMFGM